MKSFELKSRFFSRHGDSYNIPVNTVYYTESRVNTELNTYVKNNIPSLNVFMNLCMEGSQVEFMYKIVYVPRQTFDDGYADALLSLRPDLKDASHDDELEMLEQEAEVLELELSMPLDGSVICRLMPQTAYDYESRFFQTDVKHMTPEDFRLFLHSYTRKVDDWNMSLLQNRKIDYHSENPFMESFTFWYPYEGITVITYKNGQPGLSGIEDDEEREERLRNKARMIAKAAQICKDIEELQRDDGLNILHEMLAKDTLKELYEGYSSPKLSRLEISEDMKIHLPDYNMEIDMKRALCKVFYIFFLRHPEGIRLKEIADHREELFNIYKNVSNRTDLDKMKASIDAAINPEDNSMMSQCISLANKAFRNKLAHTLADSYEITNERGKCSIIKLDRSLVTLPPFLKEKMK